MVSTFFYKVIVGETDITPYIATFSFEDCLYEDDQLRLTFQALPPEMLDADAFKVGKDIEFQYGYWGGTHSPLRVMRISDVDFNYGATIDVTLKAFDYGQLLKKENANTVWVNKTTSDIAKAIAEKYALNTQYIQTTAFRYAHLPQGTRTDWELLNYLVEREAAGSWYWYIKGNDLRLEKLDLEQSPAQTFTYGVDIVSFKPSLKDAQNKGSNKTNVLLDPLTQQTTRISVDNTNAQEQTLLGKYNNSTTDKKSPNASVLPTYNANGIAVKTS